VYYFSAYSPTGIFISLPGYIVDEVRLFSFFNVFINIRLSFFSGQYWDAMDHKVSPLLTMYFSYCGWLYVYVCDENIHNAMKNEIMHEINTKSTLKNITFCLCFIVFSSLSLCKHMFFMLIIFEHVFGVNIIFL